MLDVQSLLHLMFVHTAAGHKCRRTKLPDFGQERSGVQNQSKIYSSGFQPLKNELYDLHVFESMYLLPSPVATFSSFYVYT